MKLKIKSDSGSIAVNLITPKGFKPPLPALIFVHGWKSSQKGNILRATEIAKLGFICLTLDLRGHGESGPQGHPEHSGGSQRLEQFSRKDHLEDIKAAYQYLSELKEVNPSRIGIIGSSYGGYLSAVATNDLEFEWLVLRVPALYFDKGFDISTDKLIKENPQAFTSSDLTEKNCLALKGVANFPGEILIIESEKDEIIPHAVIENYLSVIKDKRRLSYEVMKGAGHHFWNNPEHDVEYLKILKDWLEQKSSQLEVEV